MATATPSPQHTSEQLERPRFAIGHVSMTSADVERLARFYVDIGMREVMVTERMAILELLGGTHIVIAHGAPGGQGMDLIVDDVADAHAVLEAAGASPDEIREGTVHRTFQATDPEGNELTVHSTHAIGPV